MTALKKDPKQRFASVRAFANALEQAARAPLISPIVEPNQDDRMSAQRESVNLGPEVREHSISQATPATPESFDDPVPPPSSIIPVISLDVSPATVQFNDDEKRTIPLLNMLPPEQTGEIENSILTPEQGVIQQENYPRLYAARAQLTPAQQHLLHLRYDDELRLAVIAEQLGMPEDTVHEMLASALHQLRVIYEQIERGTMQ